jgi:hypothetical protein
MTCKDFKPLKRNSTKGWRCGLAAIVAGFGVALSNGTANAIDIAPGDLYRPAERHLSGADLLSLLEQR